VSSTVLEISLLANLRIDHDSDENYAEVAKPNRKLELWKRQPHALNSSQEASFRWKVTAFNLSFHEASKSRTCTEDFHKPESCRTARPAEIPIQSSKRRSDDCAASASTLRGLRTKNANYNSQVTFWI
jgi:hypothetical protein